MSNLFSVPLLLCEFWNVNSLEGRYAFLRMFGRMLGLMVLFSVTGCVHIQMNTHIEFNGRCLRALDVSVPDERADALKAAGIRAGANQEMALAKEEQWEETERTAHGRYHRVFVKRFPDPEAMSDRMIEASFGRAVQKPMQTDSDEMIRGDRVHFDMKKTLWGTTFLYEETIQLRAHSDVRPDLVHIEAEIAMPGKIVQSNAHRVEGHRAIWTFRIADGKGFVSLSVTSRTSHLPILIPMGVLILVFLIFLPGQFLSREQPPAGGQPAGGSGRTGDR